MNKLTKYFDYLLPDNLSEHEFARQRAKTLTFIHLLQLSFSFAYIVLSAFLYEESKISPYIPYFLIICQIVLFKTLGNFVISANLMCFNAAGVLLPTLLESGGIYSDDMVWLGLAPVIAVLFADKRSGIVWFVIYAATLLAFYIMEIQGVRVFRDQTLNNQPFYYLNTWLFFFSCLTSMLYLFVKGKSELVNSLLENEKKLIQQRDEMRRQAEELQQKEHELVKLNNNLEHFTYAVSHDLKEPLRTITSYSQLLNRKLGDHFDKEDRVYMDFVLSGAGRMSVLLEDLLEYSRISDLDKDFEPVDMNDIMLLVINNLNKKVKESKVEIEIESNLPLVKGTQSLLVIVMQNLIANAIKFRQIGQQAKVRIYHKEECERYVICVEDNGIGIAKEYQEKVFEIFNRLHSREEYEGSGIGLTTCGKIISSLGGEIWLDSVLGKGTTILFSLPKPKVIATKRDDEILMLDRV